MASGESQPRRKASSLHPPHQCPPPRHPRIENVLVVVPAAKDCRPRGTAAAFEHVTCAPIGPKLVEPSLMNDKELQWLNGYNAWVRKSLSPALQGDARALAYLMAQTEPVVRTKAFYGGFTSFAAKPTGAGASAVGDAAAPPSAKKARTE